MEYVRIPREIDGLMQIAVFEIDQLAIFIGCVSIGVLTQNLIQSVVIGGFIAHFFGKFKSGKSRGLLVHLLYFYGLYPMKDMWCDNGLMRHWIK